MTLQEQAQEKIKMLSDDGAAFILQVMNSMNPTLYVDGVLEQSEKNDSIEKRVGIARGEFVVPDDFDKYNDEIADMFEGK